MKQEELKGKMSTQQEENCLVVNDFYSLPFDACSSELEEHIYQTLDEVNDAKKFNYHRRSIHVMLRFNAFESSSNSSSSSSLSTQTSE